MRESKSQTVRLKEEILSALEEFVHKKGRTQQQVVSVGAWFYMCVPPILREALDEAFYEWCKAHVEEAYVRGGSGRFIERIMDLIKKECGKIEPAFEIEKEPSADLSHAIYEAEKKQGGKAVSPALATKQVLDEGLDEVDAARQRPARRVSAKAQGKDRRTG